MRDFVHDVLVQPPRVPRSFELFTSNTLFGQPGIYPDGSTMAPASGPVLDENGALAAIADGVDDAAAEFAVARFRDAALEAYAPRPTVRAALAMLMGTIGDRLVESVVERNISIDVGIPTSPGRVVGPAGDARSGDPALVVNDRYSAEHPAIIMASLAHALLWTGPGAGEFEEVILHGILAAVHVQSIARRPSLAHLGTELTRRQNSLAITLLNSRQPGDPDVRLSAPRGPGTIPGGAPGMQTRDFLGIPFAAGTDPQRHAPTALHAVMERLAGRSVRRAETLRYDRALLDTFVLDAAAGVTPLDRLRASLALGMLDDADLDAAARRAGTARGAVVDALGLDAARACWTG